MHIHFFLSIIPKWSAPPGPMYTLLCSMLTQEIQEKLMISPRLCFSFPCKPHIFWGSWADVFSV